MKRIHVGIVVAAILSLALVTACQNETGGSHGDDLQPLYGDGAVDPSRVLAKVDGEVITERMLDLRFEEIEAQERIRFSGPDGRRILLRAMVDEVLRVRDAEARKLDLDPTVARVLNSQYRMAMNRAQIAELTRDIEPTVDRVRDHFERNRESYRKLGSMHASHIECETKANAEEAYRQLTGPDARRFPYVVADFSVNHVTAASAGDLGWFNKSGFVQGIPESKRFTEVIWDFDKGYNPPFEFAGKWHVVRVHEKKLERQQSLDEAYPRVESDLMPILLSESIDDWLVTAREDTPIEYFAEFRAGQGKTAEQLFQRAIAMGNPEQKLESLKLVADEYPGDPLAAQALFLAANHVLDNWQDRRQASSFLNRILREFPEHELADDAQYVLENMHKRSFLSPKSIDDLRSGK